MKTLTIVLACLLSSSVMAQKMTGGKEIPTTNQINTLKIQPFNDDYKSLRDSGTIYSINGQYPDGITFGWPIKNDPVPLLQINSAPKPVMTVLDKDKDGSYKVWIDKKRITWTSDSTFVLRTK